MADVQILSSAVTAIPANYVLPDAAEFILKAVNADFDGSGAAGAFLPCVTILSDSGHVVARAVDQAVSVAAGGSAEVSWFPHVKHAAAASGGAVEYLILQGAGQTVVRPPVGDSDHSKFVAGTASSNNLGSWSLILDGGGRVKEVDTTVPGRYLSICQFEWAAPVVSSHFVVVANMFGGFTLSVSPAWFTTTTADNAALIGAMASLSAGTGQMTIEPAISSGDASIFYDADYWFILRFST